MTNEQFTFEVGTDADGVRWYSHAYVGVLSIMLNDKELGSTILNFVNSCFVNPTSLSWDGDNFTVFAEDERMGSYCETVINSWIWEYADAHAIELSDDRCYDEDDRMLIAEYVCV